MNKKFLGRICCLIILVFLMSGCTSTKEEKVITNVAPEQTVQQPVEAAPQVPAEKPAKKEAPASDINIKEKKKEASSPVPAKKEPEPKKAEKEKPAPSAKEARTANASTKPAPKQETGIYKGYKGPVQGEIKYKEGTPAAQNSSMHKASGDIGSPYHVQLFVTKDYGHKKMFGKRVGLVKDEVGMEVLFRNLDIQTAYGGGFVNAINNLESHYTFFTGSERKKLDWFYWVNGILAPIGIAEYRPHPGDVIWWDYHDWSTTMFIPGVIGSYPQPFKNGFGGKNPGTAIMYADGYEQSAQQLKKSLQTKGVKKIDVVPYEPGALQNPRKYYILIGAWEQLQKNSSTLEKMNTKNKLIGVYVKFADGKLHALDFNGKVITSYQQAGAIYTNAGGMGSIYPFWLITGTDQQGVQRALDTLLHRPDSITQHFGAVITESGIENVPYVN
ncbi:DUF4430 domain-containing protein [Aneurinibacillus aneurinilyticus]|uniref:DUF4430 domain-containing protein n=1 Tax=Aneurinibacillus aneurinilyticus TaxID=1391 RepID=UPI0035260B77